MHVDRDADENVIPADAGIQRQGDRLDSRVRGNDHNAASVCMLTLSGT